MADPATRKRKTFTVRLTQFELVHLRDLFSVLLPPEMRSTLSQALALAQDRALVEAKLWQKLSAACHEAEVPTDDDAPDFTVAMAGVPSIGVFELAHEVGQVEETPTSVFSEVESK